MKAGPKIIATIEARMTSSRLPGKVLMEAAGKPFLGHMIERLRQTPSLDDIIVATTANAADDPIQDFTNNLGVKCFRGDEIDVLQRVLDAALAHHADIIVEMTGDCPLIDPALVEICIQNYLESDVDYVSNIIERTYPIGMDTQVFATSILADVSKRTDNPEDREHVSLYIYRNPQLYSLKNIRASNELNWPKLRLTLDTEEDLELMRRIFEILHTDINTFGLADVLELIRKDPGLAEINAHVQHKYV